MPIGGGADTHAGPSVSQILDERLRGIEDDDVLDVASLLEIFSGLVTTNSHVRLTRQSVGAVTRPDVVDEHLEATLLPDRFAPAVSRILFGPLNPEHQVWVGVGTSAGASRATATFDRAAFSAAESRIGTDGARLVKTVAGGLHTSTGSGHFRGMWRECYLDEFFDPHRQRPWHVYRLVMSRDARVIEVDSAAAWVDLVKQCGRQSRRGLLVPDWTSIAGHYDAVHFTLRGVVATQGLVFDTEAGLIPGGSWDVECTVWTNWQVEHAELIEIEN